ncbi:lysosomal acid phosphatase-like protein [Leptotrombidium deliense]|uniref:Lysosomal acid phosphatase-like protein n=1 Tax=Leptotrombidium deliense TaxID=299467 RepID=A0A443SL23_9ACAR|nr:lysosomal acid phosphatase-like protein [Leptotrombidium deliense]
MFQIFYEFLTSKTGINVTDFNLAGFVSEILQDATANGCELPNWVDSSVWNMLKENTVQREYAAFSTTRLLKLKAGRFISELISIITAGKNKTIVLNYPGVQVVETEPLKKIFVYSTHDSFITNIMSAFQVYNFELIDYGDTILLEIFENSVHSEIKVKVLHLNDTENGNVFLLKLPFCENQEICSLKQFMAGIQHLTTDDWKLECGIAQVTHENSCSGRYNFLQNHCSYTSCNGMLIRGNFCLQLAHIGSTFFGNVHLLN